MDTKQIKTRIKHQRDIEKNWNELHSSFIPLEGEIVIYEAEVSPDGTNINNLPDNELLPEGRTTLYNYPRIKIGDGKSTLQNLPYAIEEISSEELNEIFEQTLLVNAEEVRF